MTLLLGSSLVSYASTTITNNTSSITNEVENDGVPESSKNHSDLNEGETENKNGAIKNHSDSNETENDGIAESSKNHSDLNDD